MGLTEDQRSELLPSGAHARYAHRVGWAQDSTKRHGLTESPSWGTWALTPKGRILLAAHPESLPADEIQRIATQKRNLSIATILGDDASDMRPETPLTESPEERLEAALQEIRASVARELLDRMLTSPPEFFEGLVLDLLHALGYGTSRSDLQRVGKSGDAGIDGIIALDRLGLEKVYVQAKRWQNNVGRPELQAFFGALAGQRARKGVFITTSGYTRDALDFATSVQDSIVVVDGARLTELMIDHGVAVGHRVLRLPRVDADYFDLG
jgi:restriction system protein